MAKTEKIPVENINVPGQVTYVDAAKYSAMKTAFLAILASKSPRLTQKEVLEQVKPELPDDIFPAGATSGLWAKTVQLDLEAKGVVIREQARPFGWHKV